jgi:hypothetical protein
MKPASIILTYALANMAVAAILFYLWESSSYVVSLSEAISGTATLRFWLFVSGVVGIFVFVHLSDKASTK